MKDPHWSFRMNHSFLMPLAMFLIVSSTAQALVDRGPVDALLLDPANAVHDSLYLSGDAERDARVQDALDQGAYRWALTIATESVVDQRTEAFWSASRTQQDPYAAYAAALDAWLVQSVEGLAAALERYGDAERTSKLMPGDVETLLFSAQYAVMAESSLSVGGRLIEKAGQGADSHDTSTKRRVIAYPLAQAELFTAMADRILDDFTPQTHGTSVSTEGLATVIETQGGAGNGWIFGEFGLIHRLARHLSIYELDLLKPDSTPEDIESQISTLESEHLDGVLDRGFSGARPGAAILDATWWLEHGTAGGDPQSPGQADILNRVRASVELAQYETDVLAAVALSSPVSGGWSIWAWIAAGATVIGLGLGATALVRRRFGGARRGDGLLPVLVMTVLMASTLTFLSPYAEAGPAPADPVRTPLLVAEGEGQSWGGSVLAANDGTIHFVWGECMESASSCPDGELGLHYRTFHPEEGMWSDPIVLVDEEGADAIMPRIIQIGDGLAVVWQQGLMAWTRDTVTAQPAEVWWCRLEQNACVDRERVSDGDAGVESTAVAVGPDGRLRVAWAQKSNSGGGEVVFRQQTALGWGPTIRFPDGGTDQWQPALAVDESNTAHLAWPARHPDVPGQAYRVVYHSAVGAGAVTGVASQPVSQHIVVNQGVALAVHGGDIHLAYGTEEGLFHRSLHDDEWTDAYLVSPTGVTLEDNRTLKRPAIRPELVPTMDGVVATWLEHVYPDDGLRVRMAELNEGLWLRPTTVLEPPRQALFNPHMDVDSADRVHLTWSGDAPPDSVGRQQYLTVALSAEDVAEPDVIVLAPLDGAWIRDNAIDFTVRVGLEAPLDRDRTEWLLDGSSMTFNAWSDRLSATVGDLEEGLHTVQLTVVDETGNKVVTEWSFGVDHTPPTFDFSLVDEQGATAIGWMGQPVIVDGRSDPDDGSPVTLEVQATLGNNVLQLSPGNVWTEIPAGGLQLPPNILAEVTVRARDVAGNVALSDPVQVGWDDDAPKPRVGSPPAWYTIDAPVLDVAIDFLDGSPITAEATLLPTGGEGGYSVNQPLASNENRLQFASVSDGSYMLHLTVVDAAGNQVDAGMWPVGVDTTAPMLSMGINLDSTGLHFVALDTGSGVASIQIFQNNQVLAEQSGENMAEMTLNIERGILEGTHVTVVATDVAGNDAAKAVDLESGTLADLEEKNSFEGAGKGSPDAEGKSWNAPSANPLFALMIITFITLIRRKL